MQNGAVGYFAGFMADKLIKSLMLASSADSQAYADNILGNLSKERGRIKLCLRAIAQGKGILFQLVGGDCHIGAVAISAPGKKASALALPGHREDGLALQLAEKLSEALDCPIAVSAGIHFTSISEAEIAIVRELADELASAFIATYHKPKKPASGLAEA